MATISKYVETEIEVDLDGDDLAQLVSDEGLTPGDLFNDAEIQAAAEGMADWEGWLGKALDEMSDGRIAEILAERGYVRSIVPPAPAPTPLTVETLINEYTDATPEARAVFRSACNLATPEYVEGFRETVRDEMRAEIMQKLFA